MAIVFGFTTIAVAACGGSTVGDPRPSVSEDGPTTTTTTSSGSPLPARPRDIKLDSVDPCTLWTGEQLATLRAGSEPRRNTSTAGDAMCSFDAADLEPPKASFSVAIVLDHDVTDSFLPDRGDSVVDVAGFPAVQQPAPAAGPRPCTILASTTDGQYLEVKLSYGSTEGHLSGERACELTVQAATFAVQTLQTQR